MQPFIHLHNHTSEGSLLDGFGKVELYAKRAAEMGFSHLAITDHGSCDAAIKFQNACQKENIIPIFGMEAYIVEDLTKKEKGDKRAHITLLAKNEQGFQNILKLCTTGYIEGFYYRPRIDSKTLLEHLEGLIIMTGCSESFLNYEWGRNLFSDLYDKNKEDLYLEIMPHNFEAQYFINNICLNILEQKKSPKFVATNDCHYVYPEDAKAHEVLLAIQTKSKWNDPNRWKFTGDGYYFKSYREMVQAFKEQAVIPDGLYQEALRNTMEIVEKCSGFQKIEKKTISLPTVPQFIWETDEKILGRLCLDGFSEKIIKVGKNEELYRERMHHELDLIKEKGFAKYFLIVWELIKWCKENNIMTGDRGSSAGSLICYLLGITNSDPIEYKLLFERFIDPSREDLPDIDIDFEDTKRHLIREHLEELYGKWNVAAVSTFSKIKGKSAIRDVSRVFDIPLKEVNIFCKIIDDKLEGEEGYGTTITSAIDEFEEGKNFQKKYPDVSEIAIRTESIVRQRGQHAAAIIISNEDLRDGNRCSFALGKDKEPIINWDKEDIEYVGLMKLDVLGLSTLSVLNYTRELIKENHKIDIDFEKLDLNDPKCYEEFSKGNTIGCFQVGTYGQRKFCQELGIENFEMLTHATSLYRPGTLRSDLSSSFVNRKKGFELIKYIHPLIEEITKDTYGIILYQEQLMQMVVKLAGMDWGKANKIRKIVAKSKGAEAFLEYENEFVEGCLKQKTLSELEAISLWGNLSSWGAYGFNKSHACSYSKNTYRTMWLKIYYPAEFICALLTYGVRKTDKSAEEKRNEYISEAFRLGIEIRPPKVGISDPQFWKIKNNILYAPFTEIKGIGEKTAEAFQNIKDGQGFYESGKSKRKIPDKFMKILDEIKAYDDSSVRDEESEHISSFLSISLAKGPMGKYGKLYNLLSDNIDQEKFIGLVKEKEEDLIRGNLDYLNLNFLKPAKRFRNLELLKCKDCELRKECRAPILPSQGLYNMMIIGEAPGCISGDSFIDTAFRNKSIYPDGIKIKDLVGKKDFKVYSHDIKNNKVVLGTVKKVWKTGIKKTYKVTYEWFHNTKNGKVISENNLIVTEDHKFLLNNSKTAHDRYKNKKDLIYLSIKDGLEIGDSLMPFNRREEEGYQFIGSSYKNMKKESIFLMENVIKNKIRKGYNIHHKDKNKLNDSEDNLELLTIAEHSRLHLLENNPMRNNIVKENYKIATSSIEYRKKISDSLKKKLKDPKVYKKRLEQINNSKEQISKTLKDKYADPVFYYKSLYRIKNRFNLTFDWIEKKFLSRFPNSDFPPINNHIVKKIEFIGEIDVYDMEIEKYHNFVSNGIFIHNSNEDKAGMGFIGRAGDKLWYELGLYGYLREDFFVTNVGKCYPGRIIKNPTRKHVNKCRKWLDEEMRNIHPFIILALGNANVKFFTDKDTGIMEKTEKIRTEWNEEYGCWICWNIHPASTIYNPENKELFKFGIKNFCEKIKILGQIPF